MDSYNLTKHRIGTEFSAKTPANTKASLPPKNYKYNRLNLKGGAPRKIFSLVRLENFNRARQPIVDQLEDQQLVVDQVNRAYSFSHEERLAMFETYIECGKNST